MLKVDSKVSTPDGPGSVKEIELNGVGHFKRYGVIHDVFPPNRLKMYTNDILFYLDKEISPI